MDCPTKIAVGLDAALPTPHVFAEAKLLAKTFGAELVLVHAIPEAAPLSPGFDILADQVRERFEDLRGQAEREGLKVSEEFHVRYGAPHEVILAVKKAVEANWIVIGAGGKSTLDRLLLGSTAEAVLREATCPVWIVRPGRDLVDLDRILVAVDGTTPGDEALAGALTLARSFVSKLRILTIGTTAHVERIQSQLQERIDLHGTEVEFTRREGEVPEAILAELSTSASDLLVIGHSGRRGLFRLLHANTAEALTRKSPCSFLTLHAHA
jgi:nucleotide-binding universal stress UspA family protein